MKFVEFKNTADHAVKVKDLGIECGPGKTCQVPLPYARVRQGHSGTPMASIISMMAPSLKPVNPEEVGVVPEEGQEPPKGKMPTVADLVAAGVPRGVAEQLVAAAVASAEQALEAQLAAEEKATDKGKAPAQNGKSAKG